MYNELITELKLQSQDVCNQYIAKVDKIFKTANVATFRETIMLAALALIQKIFQMDPNAAKDHLVRRANDPYISQALELLTKEYREVPLNLDSFTAMELLTYVMFSESDNKKDSDFTTGSSINKLLAFLLRKETDVFDWGFGYGQFLLFSALYGNAKSLKGIEVDADCYMVTKLRLSLLPNEPDVQLRYGNMFNEEDLYQVSRHNSCTMVIHPPFGAAPNKDIDSTPHRLAPPLRSVYDSMGPATLKSEWPYILTALEALEPGKKLYAITTNGAASTETYSTIRKNLIEQGLVNCVIQLPDNLLPGTSIASTLWIFSRGNGTVKVIDASQIRTEGRRKFTLSDSNIEEIFGLISNAIDSEINADIGSPKNAEKESGKSSNKASEKASAKSSKSNSEEQASITKSLSLLEIAKNNFNLSPSRHVGVDFPSEYILLKDVCQINRGVLLKAQELDELVADNNSVKYITPKHLTNSIIDLSKVTSLAETEDMFKKKSIGDDSIVMSKLLPFKTGYVRQVKKKQVFSNGNTYYLQINQKAINPLFLLMYLNSTMAQKQLEQLSRGSSTSTLSISDLKDLKIPVIKRAVQDKLADNYKELIKEEQRIQADLEKLEKNKRRLIEEVLG